LPDAAGSITGTSDVCAGATGIAYSVAPVANAVTYVWTLPAGASIASGSGTNSITVDFASNASPGNITVYANNICGNGAASAPFPVAIDPLPAPAGTITGQSVVCQGETGVVYTVPVIVGALGYSWNFPSGATPVNGTNTNSITLNYGPSAVSGVINVYGTNNCGNGQVSPDFNVTVNATPATPVIILHGDTLISSAPAGNQWYFMGVIIPGATSQTYVAPDQGEYWDIVTLNGCSSDTSNHIFLVVGISHIGSGSFAVYPVPNEGQFIASMTSSSKEFFTISVYNDFGVKIFEKTNIEVKGIVSQPIDLRPISDGVYSVVFRSIQGQLVKRIIVRK
jgi:hypothetical protein